MRRLIAPEDSVAATVALRLLTQSLYVAAVTQANLRQCANMMLSPALLASVLTVVSALFIAVSLRWEIWRNRDARHGLIVALGLVTLGIAWYVVIRLVVGGWPSDLGLGAFTPIIPVLAIIIGWQLNVHDERTREQRQHVRTVEERWLASQRETISDLQFALVEAADGVRNQLTTVYAPEAAAQMDIGIGENEPWVQALRTADQKIRVLAPRLSDEDLRKTIDTHIDDVLAIWENESLTQQELLNVLKQVESTFRKLNDRAGAFYRELGAPMSPEPEQPWWHSLWRSIW